MLLSIVIILLVGFIAYFHYVQGFFTAGLSAVLAVISAILAMSTHETVVHWMLKGRFADQAYALALVALFAVYYSVLRFIFDKLVPGNVRFPVIVEKVGAAVMGLIAGAFATGIVVIAAETLPFGWSIGTYSRFSVESDVQMPMNIPGRSQQQDVTFDRLDAEKFLKDQSTGLLIPVDDLVVALTAHVSGENGSLSSSYPFERIHPDYLQELFGQRAGIQISSRHAALPDQDSITVEGLYTPGPGQYTAVDPEQFEEGPGQNVGVRPVPKGKKAELPKHPAPGNVLLVVRVNFKRENMDEKSRVVALTPGAVRIALKDREGEYKNYFMIGESDDAKTLYLQQPDDYVFVPDSKGVDLIFELPKDAFQAGKNGHLSVAEGSMLLEVKRMARVWLSGDVKPSVPTPPKDQLELVKKAGGPPGRGPITQDNSSTPGNTGGNTRTSSNPGAANSPLAFSGSPVISNALFTSIPTAQGNSGIDAWGTYEMRNNQFTSLQVEGGKSMELLANGPNPVNQLAVPEGQRMIQVTARPQGEPWNWANHLRDFALTDASGNRFPVQGIACKVRTSSGQTMLVIQYNATKAADYSAPRGELASSSPGDVILMFLAPVGAQIKGITYNGAQAADVSLNVQ